MNKGLVHAWAAALGSMVMLVGASALAQANEAAPQEESEAQASPAAEPATQPAAEPVAEAVTQEAPAAGDDDFTPPVLEQETDTAGEEAVVAEAPVSAGRFERMSLAQLMNLSVPDVEAASRREESANDAPAAVYVISKEDILARGYANLKDVLRDVPGMETIEYYFSEMGTLVPVRGVVGNNKIIVLVDGMRVNPPGAEPMMFRSDFSVRQAEQVEIVYGPGSVLYGQDGVSAVINVRTKQNPDDEMWVDAGASGGAPTRYEVWASAGANFGDGARAIANVQYFDAELSSFKDLYPDEWANTYEPVHGARKYSTLETGAAATDPQRWDRGLNASVQLKNKDFSLHMWHRQSSRSSSEGSTQNSAKIEDAIWSDMTTLIEGKNSLRLTDALQLDSILTFSRYEIDPKSRYIFPTSGTPGGYFEEDFKYGIGHKFSWEERLGWNPLESLHLVAGAALTQVDVVPKATVPGGAVPETDLSSQGGEFVYYTQAGDAASRQSVKRVNNVVYRKLGVYAEGSYNVIKPLRIIAGIRIDRDARFDELPVSTRLALVFRPLDELTLKLVGSTAYVAPAAYFSYNTFRNTDSLNIANPDLKPESAMAGELNATYSTDSTLVGFSAYLTQQDNLIATGEKRFAVNVLGDIFLDEAGTQQTLLTQTANIGESKAFGGDLYVRQSLFDMVSLWGSYSYTDFTSRIEDGGTVIEGGMQGISHHNLRLGATVAPLGEQLYLTASAVVRSTPQGIPEFTNAATVTTLRDAIKNPYELAFHGLYQLNSQVGLFADIQNLTNNKYALAGIRAIAIPKDGFRLMAGLRIGFER